MAADERGEDLGHSQPVGWGVVRDAFQGVDPAQADVKPVSAGLAELVDGAGESLGDLAFLGDGDLLPQPLVAALGLLAGQFELLAGAIIAALRLLAGLLELLPADADLPQGDRGADPGAAEDKQGRQALEQGGAGVVLEFVAAFAARGLLSGRQPARSAFDRGEYRRWGSTATHNHSAVASSAAPAMPANAQLRQRRCPRGPGWWMRSSVPVK